MDQKQFEKVVKEQFKLCSSVLIKKGDEYSTADKLHNFKQAAHIQGSNQQQALAGMLAKHTVSIFDMIRKDENFPMNLWDEKLTDHINYLLLLRAIIVEEKGKIHVN